MTEMYVLGIDAGTSVVKAALFDRAGALRVTARRRTTVFSPQPGWTEASLDETWQAAAQTIREVLARGGVDGRGIAAVGVTGQMLGAWMVDEAGAPVRSAILWNDGRTQALLARLEAKRPGLMSEIFRRSGSVMQQGCSLPVLRWLAENDSDAMSRARWLLCSKDWIRFKLTGNVHTDPTDAALLPGNVRTRDLDDTLFELLGVSDYRHLFPAVAPSDAIVGAVTRGGASQTGLRRGTPVVTGAGDVPAVALGVGAVQPGQACSIVGTTVINGHVVEEPVFTPPDVGLLFCLPGDRWLRSFANIAGTTNVDWASTMLGVGAKPDGAAAIEYYGRLEELIRGSPPGARGVLFLPYLSAVGILAPVLEPTARAQISGLTPDHDATDILRAVYEGVALSIRDCYSVASRQVEVIRLSGGGARSELWTQIIADVTGCTIEVPAGEEFGAKGAALLAGVGIGWYPSIVEAATAHVAIAREYAPDAERAHLYDQVFEVYQDLRERLIPFWRAR
ncbi:MAG: carbohydrate kinase, partial [Chloroflexota bacterium]|nr:carbohydrate kinase [Chloroflexota bacterium]